MAKKDKTKKVPGEAVLKNPKHELFCWVYAGYHNARLFGNGTQSYMQAYGYNSEIDKINEKIEIIRAKKGKKDAVTGEDVGITVLEAKIKSIKHVAQTLAYDLMTKKPIRQRIDYLLSSYITHDHGDRELQFVILQRNDLASKVAAIREYNRLKERGNKGVLEGNFTFTWEKDDDDTPSTKKKKNISAAVAGDLLKKNGAKLAVDNGIAEWDDDE